MDYPFLVLETVQASWATIH
uniref:Uncharacterized protein n=1 Tax=Anguilla anguilla TaxID=7936 RepID=A0A0E9PEH2_ANGAN